LEAWRDRITLFPRNSTADPISPAIWQGVTDTMSRSEVEAHLSSFLKSRTQEQSEFDTPLGKLLWRIDREISGGDEAKITRMYLYPRRLTLDEVFSRETVDCLRALPAGARYLVVMRGSEQGQRATLEIEGSLIKKIIWRPAGGEPSS
jgi:hypothetical protein